MSHYLTTDADSQRGQAVFELIIFMPFLLMLLSVVLTIGNAINGSINQQKAARGYFYARVKNNSTIPKSNDGGWNNYGMFFIGWKEKFSGGATDGGVPVAPCYPLQLPLDKGDSSCENWSTNTTQFLRVQTVYGACGATYQHSGNYEVRSPYASGVSGCVNQ